MNEIFTRVSTRKFEDRPVEPEKITQLLKAAMQAPSAGNQQPWEFFVVTDKDKIKSLSQSSPYAGCAAISGLGGSPTSIGGISLAVRCIPLCLLFLLRYGAYFPPELFSMLRLSMLRQRIRGANATYIYLAHAPA